MVLTNGWYCPWLCLKKAQLAPFEGHLLSCRVISCCMLILLFHASAGSVCLISSLTEEHESKLQVQQFDEEPEKQISAFWSEANPEEPVQFKPQPIYQLQADVTCAQQFLDMDVADELVCGSAPASPVHTFTGKVGVDGKEQAASHLQACKSLMHFVGHGQQKQLGEGARDQFDGGKLACSSGQHMKLPDAGV